VRRRQLSQQPRRGDAVLGNGDCEAACLYQDVPAECVYIYIRSCICIHICICIKIYIHLCMFIHIDAVLGHGDGEPACLHEDVPAECVNIYIYVYVSVYIYVYV